MLSTLVMCITSYVICSYIEVLGREGLERNKENDVKHDFNKLQAICKWSKLALIVCTAIFIVAVIGIQLYNIVELKFTIDAITTA